MNLISLQIVPRFSPERAKYEGQFVEELLQLVMPRFSGNDYFILTLRTLLDDHN